MSAFPALLPTARGCDVWSPSSHCRPRGDRRKIWETQDPRTPLESGQTLSEWQEAALSPKTGWLGTKEQVWGGQAETRHCLVRMGLLPCTTGTQRWLANGGIWGEAWLEVGVCRHKQRPLQSQRVSQRLPDPQTRGCREGRTVRMEDHQETGAP